MLNRRERRFADRQADKLIAQLKRDNKLITPIQSTNIQPMEVSDDMLNEYKQYTDGMRMQKTTGDSEPSTNTGTTNT
jgi:NADP-dependent 3-hydroxy acid dehydrogenase YdfG